MVGISDMRWIKQELYGGSNMNTFPSSCKFIFCEPKIRECRVISGVAAEMNDSARIPRFLVYHSFVVAIDFTVRTRWSKDWIVHAGFESWVVDILRCWVWYGIEVHLLGKPRLIYVRSIGDMQL